jgi:hypothetical protein
MRFWNHQLGQELETIRETIWPELMERPGRTKEIAHYLRLPKPCNARLPATLVVAKVPPPPSPPWGVKTGERVDTCAGTWWTQGTAASASGCGNWLVLVFAQVQFLDDLRLKEHFIYAVGLGGPQSHRLAFQLQP